MRFSYCSVFFAPICESQLWESRVLFKWILISIGIFMLGRIISDSLNTDFSFTYYLSPMPFLIIILHRTLGEFYRIIFNKIPYVFDRHKNFFYSLLVRMSTLTIPFLLDSFVIQKYMTF